MGSRIGSNDTAINSEAILAINDAVRYEEEGDEDCDEDRILLLEETQGMIL